jgi:CBS domain-containing protein
MKAAEIMTKNVVTIRGSATVAEAVKLMKDKGLTALIVTPHDEEDAYGIVTKTDIAYKVIAFGVDPKQVRVYEIMTKPCIVVNPDLGIEYVAQLFARTGIHIAPIIQGTLLGTISISDILAKGDFVEQPQTVLLDKIIEEAIADARNICAERGAKGKECAVAWGIVEELQAEAARQKAEKLPKTAFEEYCQEYPEALEARMLERWCSG